MQCSCVHHNAIKYSIQRAFACSRHAFACICVHAVACICVHLHASACMWRALACTCMQLHPFGMQLHLHAFVMHSVCMLRISRCPGENHEKSFGFYDFGVFFDPRKKIRWESAAFCSSANWKMLIFSVLTFIFSFYAYKNVSFSEMTPPVALNKSYV